MPLITRNFDEFARAAIQNPNAKVRIQGQNIVFLTEGKAKESLKDLGRFILGGFSLRNHHTENNYAVTQKLREWRAEEGADSAWKGFGKENLTKVIGERVNDHLQAIVDEVRPNVPVADALQTLRRFERCVAVADRGFTANVRYPEVSATHRSILGSSESVDREIRNGSYVFSEDRTVPETLTEEIFSKEPRTNAEGGARRIVTPERPDSPPVVSKLAPKAATPGVATSQLLDEFEHVQDQLYILNEAIKDGSVQYGQGGMEDGQTSFQYFQQLRKAYLQRYETISNALQTDMNNMVRVKPSQQGAIQNRIQAWTNALTNSIALDDLQTMRDVYWTHAGEAIPTNRINLFVDLNKAPVEKVSVSNRQRHSMTINNPPPSLHQSAVMEQSLSPEAMVNAGWDFADDIDVDIDQILEDAGWDVIENDAVYHGDFIDGHLAASDSLNPSAAPAPKAKPSTAESQAAALAQGFTNDYLAQLSDHDLEDIRDHFNQFKTQEDVQRILLVIDGIIADRATLGALAPTPVQVETPKAPSTIRVYSEDGIETVNFKALNDIDLAHLADRLHEDLKGTRNAGYFGEETSKALALLDKELRLRGLEGGVKIADLLNIQGSDYAHQRGLVDTVYGVEKSVLECLEDFLGQGFDRGDRTGRVPIRFSTVFDSLCAARTALTVQTELADNYTSDDPAVFQGFMDELYRNLDEFKSQMDENQKDMASNNKKTYVAANLKHMTLFNYVSTYQKVIANLEHRNNPLLHVQAMNDTVRFANGVTPQDYERTLGVQFS